MTHTPTPWRVTQERKYQYIDGPNANVQMIAKLAPATIPEQKANAEFIVRAVNAHDALVAALQAISEQAAWKDDGETVVPGFIMETVRAALKLARDEQ